MSPRIRQRRGGIALPGVPELAAALTLLITLGGGAADYGWFLHQQVMLHHAVHQAATASQSVAVEDADLVAQSRLAEEVSGLGIEGPVYGGLSVTEAQGAHQLRVTAAVPYKPLLGWMPTPSRLRAEQTLRLDP